MVQTRLYMRPLRWLVRLVNLILTNAKVIRTINQSNNIHSMDSRWVSRKIFPLQKFPKNPFSSAILQGLFRKTREADEPGWICKSNWLKRAVSKVSKQSKAECYSNVAVLFCSNCKRVHVVWIICNCIDYNDRNTRKSSDSHGKVIHSTIEVKDSVKILIENSVTVMVYLKECPNCITISSTWR